MNGKTKENIHEGLENLDPNGDIDVADSILPSSQGTVMVMIIITSGLLLAGHVTTDLLSSVLYVSAFIVFLLGSYRISTTLPPPEIFEIGMFHGRHQYRDVTIEVTVEIRYDEHEVLKLRDVKCTAVAEDGTVIISESDMDRVGEKPYYFGLFGGDFDNVRSTIDHILAVSNPVHEHVDGWLASGGNDPMIKSALETEFENIESEIERETGVRDW